MHSATTLLFSLLHFVIFVTLPHSLNSGHGLWWIRGARTWHFPGDGETRLHSFTTLQKVWACETTKQHLSSNRSNTDHRQAQMTSLDPNNWHPLMTDFNKPAQIRQLVEPADHIVICLGSSVPANTPLRWRDLQWGTDAVNRQLPVDITRHAVETGKETLVYISRIGANVDSKSAVLRAHGRAEIEIRELMPSAIIIRPSDVFSLIGNFNFDIMKQAARRLRYKSVPVYPEMMHRRSQPVQNLDIGVACAMALRDPSCWGKTYELGGRQELSYDELLNFVCSVTNSPKETIMMPYPVQKYVG